jgi:NACHT domain
MRRRFESIGEIFLNHVHDSKRWRDDFIQAIRDNVSKYGNLQEDDTLSTFIPNEEYLQQENQIQHRLLSRLRYYAMRERHERILEAYHKTFEWLFDNPSGKQKPWTNFRKWLSGNDQLYWITGKPGSGKSTLMKFLYHDPRTSQQLRAWAGDKPLIVATFFFWNSGGIMQMSEVGLLRSLLFDILYQCPDLIPAAFPDRWEIYRLFGEDKSPLDQFELHRALKLAAQQCTLSRRLCLFIDGLDEFEGDHNSLVDIVKDIKSVSNVKFCVSSRPWPIFEETFKSGPSLTLQDLTFPDIQLYVTGKCASNSGFRDLQEEDPKFAHKLVLEITSKSSGVFLWVRLVVHSLLKGLMDGDRLSDLWKRLYDFPPQLEELFLKMLQSIDECYREHASQLFQLHRGACSPPTLLFLSFADEDDPYFAITMDIRPLYQKELHYRCKRMRRRLVSRCKGFLEVAQAFEYEMPHLQALLPSGTAVSEYDTTTAFGTINFEDESDSENQGNSNFNKGEEDLKVEYIHRTVKDFFSLRDIWLKVTQGTAPTFNPARRLCAGTLALVKIKKPDLLSVEWIWDLATSCIEYAISSETHTGASETLLLDELDSSLTTLASFPDGNGSTFIERQTENIPSGRHWTHTRFSWNTTSPFLHLAAMCGITCYLKDKLQPSYVLLSRHDRISTPILYSATCSGSFAYYEEKPFCSRATPHLHTIRMLLNNHADPNQMHQGISPWFNIVALAKTRVNSPGEHNEWMEALDIFERHGAQPAYKDIIPVSSHSRTLIAEEAAPTKKSRKRLSLPTPVPPSVLAALDKDDKIQSSLPINRGLPNLPSRLGITIRSRISKLGFLTKPRREKIEPRTGEPQSLVGVPKVPKRELQPLAGELISSLGNPQSVLIVSASPTKGLVELMELDRPRKQPRNGASYGSEQGCSQKVLTLDDTEDEEGDIPFYEGSEEEQDGFVVDAWGRKWKRP